MKHHVWSAFAVLFFVVSVVYAGSGKYFEEVDDIRHVFEEHPDKLVVLFVSQAGCVACGQLSKQVIKPILRGGQYKNRIAVREISMDDGKTLKNMDGQAVSTQEFLKKYNVLGSPTLVFVNNRGDVVHPPMFGFGTPDFYSFYVEKALDKSLLAIKNGKI